MHHNGITKDNDFAQEIDCIVVFKYTDYLPTFLKEGVPSL